jgi:tetratricopeptide (TPR) repeat protein
MKKKSEVLMELLDQFIKHRDGDRTAQAIATMKEILELAPNWDHGLGWFQLAVLYVQCGEFEAALDCCEKARAYAVHNLDDFIDPVEGIVLAELGRFDDSFRVVEPFLRYQVGIAKKNPPELNSTVVHYVEQLSKIRSKCPLELYERLNLEIPEGADYWKSLKSC